MWASFLASMAAVTGLLALGDGGAAPGFAAASIGVISNGAAPDPILRTNRPIDRDRWTSIVIHHSGEPAGDPETMHRLHLSWGYQAMGFHFLIGNGNGMGNGVVHVGERWIEQEPGWHAIGPDADYYNEHAIAICLIGNGDRRRFTERQMAQLVTLVRQLQRNLNIPASAVRLHRDVAGGLTTSPGRYFSATALEQQLLDPVH